MKSMDKNKKPFSFEDFEKGLMLAGYISPANSEEVRDKELLAEYDKEQAKEKKHQVLLQMFALKRMRNQRSLKWWSLVQAVTCYGWGIGRTALDATHKWGLTCSSQTRN